MGLRRLRLPGGGNRSAGLVWAGVIGEQSLKKLLGLRLPLVGVVSRRRVCVCVLEIGLVLVLVQCAVDRGVARGIDMVMVLVAAPAQRWAT